MKATLPVEVPESYAIYECSSGHHEVAAPKPLNKCPGYWLGSPCRGKLVRVGKGSRPGRTETNARKREAA